MAVELTDVESAILLSSAYALELGDKMYSEQLRGCEGYCEADKIERILWFESMLENKIQRDELDDEETDHIYSCLLDIIQDYSGSSLSVDPNAVVPGITIIVEGGSGSNLPPWIDVFWADMDNDVDGYRDTYYNPLWIGLNPAITVQGTVMYQVDVDYTNDGLGTIVFNAGKGLYDGSYFRAENYQPYTAPTPPTVLTGEILIVNNSTQDVIYNDNWAGDVTLVAGDSFSKNPLTAGQSFLTKPPVGTTYTFSVYDSDGNVLFGDSFPNPNSTSNNLSAMSISRAYYIVITDTILVPFPITWT